MLVAMLVAAAVVGFRGACLAAVPELSPWSAPVDEYNYEDYAALFPENSGEDRAGIHYYPADGNDIVFYDEDEAEALGIDTTALPKEFVNRGVPILSINLNGTTLATINSGSKDTKYPGNAVSLYEAEEIVLNSDDVEIKGRGNSTWRGIKKPYQIKFSSKTDILGMGEAKKWVLLANLNDSTHLRNEIALSMAYQIKLNKFFSGRFVELYVDGQYVGLYYLTHKVEIGSNVLNLDQPDAILVENDSIHQDTALRHVSAIEGQYIYLKETKDSAYEESSLRSFGEAYDRFEADCYEGNWAAVSKEIDTVSFAKYYLISEISANPDANHSSFYMYKNGEQDVIHVGPAWDYDLAFGRNGSGVYHDTNRLWTYNDTYNVPDRTSRIFTWLLDMPQFRTVVELTYQNVVRSALEEQLQTLRNRASEIREAGMADNELWHKEGFDTEVDRLRSWLRNRKAFLDYYYGGNREEFAEGDYVLCSDDGLLSAEYDSAELFVSESMPAETRLFHFLPTTNGSYVLVSMQSDKVLHDNNLAKYNEANLRQKRMSEFSSDCCQWSFMKNEDGTYSIFSKNSSLVITRTKEGLVTKVWSGDDSQKFRVIKVTNQNTAFGNFLQRLYKGCLGRDADATGLSNWKDALYDGATGNQIAVGFLGSREFINLGLSDEKFIEALYKTVFGRNADSSGLASWLKVLENGATRAKVEEGFLNSREMRNLCEEMGVAPGVFRSDDMRDIYYNVTAFVARLYKNCLGRNFDNEGMAHWLEALTSGSIGGKDAVLGFFSSSEMVKQSLSDREFVTVAYRTLLDREPDNAGMSAWLDAIKSGSTRQQIVESFAESKEFDNICKQAGIKK
jgi:hypothetical protein